YHLDRPLVVHQHDIVGFDIAVDQGRRLAVHVGQHVADAACPLDDLLDRERLAAIVFHDLEKILTTDKLQDEVSGLALLDEIVDPWDDGNALQQPQDFGFAAEEIQANGEFLRVGADHVFYGNWTLAVPRINGQVDGAKAADGQLPLDAIPALQDSAGGGGQR